MSNVASRHEMRHAIAAGIGLVALGVNRDTYDRVRFHAWVSHKDAAGEFALHPSGLRDDIRRQAMALAAYGPAAVLPKAVSGLLTGDDHVRNAVFRKAMLSDSDIEAALEWEGPHTTCALAVRGTQLIEAGLGAVRLGKLAKLIGGLDTAALPDWLLLRVVVPFSAAEKALVKAKLEITAHNRRAFA